MEIQLEKLTKKNFNIAENKNISFVKKEWQKNYWYYLMLVLPVIYFLVFKYLPMYGIVLAFNKYKPGGSIFGDKWVGLFYFKMFFTDETFYRALKNTLLLSAYGLTVGFPIPIIFALLLNEIKSRSFKKIVQTTSYLPNFISIVVIVGMINQMLSPGNGVINLVLSYFGKEPIHFMAEPKMFRHIYIISGIWQTMGWNAILYLSALSGINPDLYEAAEIDGAGRLKKTLHITLPGIMPTIMITLIMSVGNMISIGYEKILLMYNPLTYETADVISTYVYRIGLGDSNYSFATAVGVFESAVSLILLVTANTLSRKLTETSLW